MEQADAPAPIWLIFVIIGGFAIVFPLFWCGVVWITSLMGGWRSLAKRYRAGEKPVTGVLADSVNGMVGLASYRYTLTLHFTSEGFFMETMPLFRAGHPRLFIPWSEVTERKRAQWFFHEIDTLRIGDPHLTTVRLPSRVIDGAMEKK